MWLELAVILAIGYLVKTLIQRGKGEIVVGEDGQAVKPYSSIPGPKGWPFIGTGISSYRKYKGRLHQYFLDRAQYGPIMKGTAFGHDIVVIYGVDIIEELARKNDKYPSTFKIDVWIDYKRRHGEEMGLLTSHGPQWKKLRGPWNQSMMKSTNVYGGINELNSINSDFIERILRRRNNKNLVEDIDKELFRWSLESACSYLFEKRLGCLDDDKESEIFITAVKELFLTSEMLANCPVWLAKIFQKDLLARHDSAWNIINTKAKKEVDSKITEIAKDLEEGVEPTGFLSQVIATHKLTPGEIYSTVSEIMASAVDTTSNTTQFILYELSRNPDIQQKVYEEICEVTGGAHPTEDHLRRMDYLKATIRDVQRLYPVTMGASRTTNEDMTLGGYFIPKESTIIVDAFANGRNPEHFKNPLQLIPERWLKREGSDDINPMANIVFGFGSRGCIGRKTAETEMQILLIRILQTLELKYGDDKPVDLVTKGMVVPHKPVPVAFADRM